MITSLHSTSALAIKDLHMSVGSVWFTFLSVCLSVNVCLTRRTHHAQCSFGPGLFLHFQLSLLATTKHTAQFLCFPMANHGWIITAREGLDTPEKQ